MPTKSLDLPKLKLDGDHLYPAYLKWQIYSFNEAIVYRNVY